MNISIGGGDGALAARKHDKQGLSSKSLVCLSKSLLEQQKIGEQKPQSAFKLLSARLKSLYIAGIIAITAIAEG